MSAFLTPTRREVLAVAAAAIVAQSPGLVGSGAYVAPASGQSGSEAAPTYDIALPQGYRDWALISIARVGGPVNDMRAKLGNDVAMRAFRDEQMPFPDGTIIARLAWNAVTSEENNNALRPALERALGPDAVQKTLAETFVAGPPTNVQFMVKDSKKYATTAGWGFRRSRPASLVMGRPRIVTSFSPVIPVRSPRVTPCSLRGAAMNRKSSEAAC